VAALSQLTLGEVFKRAHDNLRRMAHTIYGILTA
jgi:hypothetical protein